MSCLSAADLATAAQDGLGAVDGAVKHIADCDTCSEALAALICQQDAAQETEDTRFGRYVILRKFGAGKYGHVYEAHDPDLDRIVALKVIPTGDVFESAEAITREAQAMAKVEHANVVSIYDAWTEDETVFLTMQAVEGAPLDRWLIKTPRTDEAVLNVCSQVAQGLAAVHAAGIVHRDLKPSNIIIDEHGNAYLTDFGLATATGHTVDADELADVPIDQFTKTATFAGTPAYMAPEVLRGAASSQASDVYALAVVTVEALTGNRPYSATTIEALKRAQRQPVANKSLIARGVPRRVASTLSRALFPASAQRRITAQELAQLLSPQRASKRVRQRVALLGIASLAVAGVVGGRAWMDRSHDVDLQDKYRTCTQEFIELAAFGSDAELARVDAVLQPNTPSGFVWPAARDKIKRLHEQIIGEGQRSCRATYVLGGQTQLALESTKTCVDAVAQTASNVLTRLEKRGDGSRPVLANISQWTVIPCVTGSYAQRYSEAPKHELEGIHKLDTVLTSLNESLRMRDRERVTSLRQERDQIFPSVSAITRRNYTFEFESRVHAARGEWQALERLANQELADDADREQTASVAWVRLIEALLKQDRRDEAEVAVTAAARALKRVADEPTLRSRFLNYKARLAYLDGRFADAELALRELIQVREQLDDEVALSHSLRTLGIVSLNLGKTAEAKRYLERARSLMVAWQGPTEQGSLEVQSTLADLALRENRYDEAKKMTEQVLAAVAAVPIRKDWFAAESHARLARIALATKNLSEAKRHLDLAVGAARGKGDRNRRIDLQALQLKVFLAEKNLRAALSLCEKFASQPSPKDSEAALMLVPALASCANMIGDKKPLAAVALYEKTLLLAQQAGAQHWLAWTHIALGLLHAKRKAFDGAATHLELGLAKPSSLVKHHVRMQAAYTLAAAHANRRAFSNARTALATALRGTKPAVCQHPVCQQIAAACRRLEKKIARASDK